MKRKTERQKFEAYMDDKCPGWSFDREPGGGYIATWLEGAWIGWQAAKRQAKREQRSKKP